MGVAVSGRGRYTSKHVCIADNKKYWLDWIANAGDATLLKVMRLGPRDARSNKCWHPSDLRYYERLMEQEAHKRGLRT